MNFCYKYPIRMIPCVGMILEDMAHYVGISMAWAIVH